MSNDKLLRAEELKESIKEYIEYDDSKFIYTEKHIKIDFNKDEVLSIINQCNISFNPTSIFGSKSYFYKEFIEIKIPIQLIKKLEPYKKYLEDICTIYYEPVGDYEFWGISILPQKKKVLERNVQPVLKIEKEIVQAKDVIYDNFKIQVINNSYDEIEKNYIIEACECGINGNKLATATMIGCAAERLLVLLCEAYLNYLESNGSSREVSKFKDEVLNAKKAHKRLDGFFRVVSNKKQLFEELGFENHEVNFSFLDIIRQVRNDAGHPTGKIIESDKLQTIISNYSLLYEKIHEVIIKLEAYNK